MRTISIVILGLALVAAIQLAEAGGKKGAAKKCTDDEKAAADAEDAQALEDCVLGKLKEGFTLDDETKAQADCQKSLNFKKKGGCHAQGKGLEGIFSKITEKIGGLFDGLKGGAKGGGAGDMLGNLKGVFDKIIGGIGKK